MLKWGDIIKQIIKLLTVFTLFIFLSGCWNYNELNDLAIATVFAIDKDGDNYLVSLTIANANNAQGSAKEGQSSISVLEGSGSTITEALEKLDLTNSKILYLNHLSAIVMSEDIAKEGVNNIIDLLMRDPNTRKKFYLVVTKDAAAKEVASILTGLEARPSQYITNAIRNSTEYQGIATDISYSSFVNEVITDGINPSLTSISINGDPDKGSEFSNIETTIPNATIVLGPTGIFKNDKLLGFATDEQSLGINLLLNDVYNFTITTECGNEKIVAKIEQVKTDIKINRNNDDLVANINIDSIGSLIEVNCDIDLLDENTINDLEKEFESEIKDIIIDALSLTQNDYKSDIFGFGEKLYYKEPTYFNNIKDIWDDEYFPNIKSDININLDLETKGSLSQTIRKDTEER